jgi:hypothetical protein
MIKKAAVSGSLLRMKCRFHQSERMASTGQTSAQVPQLVHSSGLIHRFPSFSLIASTGHSDSQAPQLVHSSVILYAIVALLLVSDTANSTARHEN